MLTVDRYLTAERTVALLGVDRVVATAHRDKKVLAVCELRTAPVVRFVGDSRTPQPDGRCARQGTNIGFGGFELSPTAPVHADEITPAR
ncbi:hypothetical protein BMS3Bbin02_02014 [bacterium BMS3Bbin02]|nr:hypothetical protein BMS3Bbin02_02014 [bacterium BMS3Bbin02]